MKRNRNYVVSLVVLILALLVAAWFFVIQPSPRHFLFHNVDYNAVSVACLDLMTQPQYKPLFDQYPSGDDPRLPAAIRDVKAFWLDVRPNEVTIWKTGGFHHMGLVFHRSTTATNAYDLVFQEEGHPYDDILLYTLPLPKDAP
jgi:hypothetical protein